MPSSVFFLPSAGMRELRRCARLGKSLDLSLLSDEVVVNEGSGSLFTNPLNPETRLTRTWSPDTNDRVSIIEAQVPAPCAEKERCKAAEEREPALDLPPPPSPTTLALVSEPQNCPGHR